MALVVLTAQAIALKPVYAESKAKPNIIFIMADDLGYAGLGCYGQKKIHTPHIDRLAAEGMRFTQCYSGSHVCAPSRSTLMTGLHTGHTPIRANGSGLALLPDDVTIAEILKRQGYATGCFGKWGLGAENTTGHPNRQGFDQFFGQLLQVHAHFYYPYFMWKNETRFMLPENEGRKRVRYAQDEIHQQALNFIRANKDRPFFCYVPYIIPRVELVVPEESMKPYLGKFPESPLPDPRKGYIGAEKPYATCAGMISRMDGQVGEIMALLKELKIDDNTIVFFTSDNGGQGGAWTRMTDFFDANAPFRGYKGTFYEGGLRVPMIARWPGRIQAGRKTDHICAFWDVLPTLTEIGGGQVPNVTDGISFLPTLLGNKNQARRKYLYWEYPYGKNIGQAVRMGSWKAIKQRGSDKLELYNLKNDVGETKDVASEHADIVAHIKKRMQEAHEQQRPHKQRKRYSYKDFVR